MTVNGTYGSDSASRDKDHLDEISYFLGYLLQAQTRLHRACVACKALQRKGVRHGNCSTSCHHQSPLVLPYECFQLETGDRGISLHGRDNTERSHNSGNASPFALVIDHVTQIRWSLSSHALKSGCQCSFEPCCIPTATWHPDTASMLRRQGVMCRCLAVIGTSPKQGRASAIDLTKSASRSIGRTQWL